MDLISILTLLTLHQTEQILAGVCKEGLYFKHDQTIVSHLESPIVRGAYSETAREMLMISLHFKKLLPTTFYSTVLLISSNNNNNNKLIMIIIIIIIIITK